MTPTEDREIDARIAEKVFGWKWKRDMQGRERFLLDPNHFVFGDKDFDDADGSEPVALDPSGYCSAPHYTTNAADSKALRDRLAELGWIWSLRLGTNGAFYMHLMPASGTGRVEHAGIGDTEFRAVAVCALKAVGVEL